MKRKILVVYAALNHPLRDTTKQMIECFRRYSDDYCFYLNLAHKRAPSYVREVDYDLVVFQTTFTQRLSRSENHYRLMTARAAALKQIAARKVALVQDEFWNVAKVERFLLDAGVETVFSVSPETEWPKLYPNVDPKKTRFHRVLTGYFDDDKLDSLIAIGQASTERQLDIVYRSAGKPNPAWGRHGYLKRILAEAVRAQAPAHGLKIDISTDGRDAKYGDDWNRFLASSRYTIGVESGTSLTDRDGSITVRVGAYMAQHPGASFEEVEAACFPGMDGNVRIAAIGPRHIEACATRTCQILTEGDYNGLLKAGLHYIPLARDLSNLPDVLASLGDEPRRCAIVERAFNDIVAPREVTYSRFVRELLDASFAGPGLRTAPPISPAELRILKRMQRLDAAEWAVARHFSKPVRRVRDFLQKLAGGRREAPAG